MNFAAAAAVIGPFLKTSLKCHFISPAIFLPRLPPIFPPIFPVAVITSPSGGRRSVGFSNAVVFVIPLFIPSPTMPPTRFSASADGDLIPSALRSAAIRLFETSDAPSPLILFTTPPSIPSPIHFPICVSATLEGEPIPHAVLNSANNFLLYLSTPALLPVPKPASSPVLIPSARFFPIG